jgi:ribosomal protein L37AE/L43A
MLNIVFECPACGGTDLENWTEARLVICQSCGWSGLGWAPMEEDGVAVDDSALNPNEA